MPIPIRARVLSPDQNYWIETSDDGSRTLVRVNDNVAYHSGCGAATECDHVYLLNGGIDSSSPERWPRVILEVGLGTGLAMLRTIDQAIQAGQPMQYHAIEFNPLSTNVLQQLQLGSTLQTEGLADRFLQWCSESLLPDQNKDQATWTIDAERRLTVHLIDLRQGLPNCIPPIDTIYFDPFDPATNPELWTAEIFQMLLERVRPGGRLVSYCVKSIVRQALCQSGWEVTRIPGPPGGKREVLRAFKPCVGSTS